MTDNSYYHKKPTISFRCQDRAEFDRFNLLASRSGKSISKLLRESLLELERTETVSYMSGYRDGLKKIVLPCSVCGTELTFDLSRLEFKAKVEEALRGYLCSKCSKFIRHPVYMR